MQDSSLQGKGNDVVIESLEIAHERMDLNQPERVEERLESRTAGDTMPIET